MYGRGYWVWGRKDCFPGADGSTIQQILTEFNASTIPIYSATGSKLTEGMTAVRMLNITTSGVLSGNTSQMYAIKNPLTFIYNTATPYDWYANSTTYQNNNLWSTVKSAYDPCPKGWQVASELTWSDFTSTNFPYYIEGKQNSSGDYYATNGRLYNHCTWYPATGWRYGGAGGQGRINRAGYYGHSWSHTTRETSGVNLGFGFTDVNINPSNNRTQGMPIRCMQE